MSAPIGLENRESILPNPGIPSTVPGIFGPDYSVADNVPMPKDVGVRDGDQISDVIGAVRGAAYYIDLIGFGESSNPLTSGMGVKPLGVNTWIRSGVKCSNGADAWQYIEGIPKGDSVGKRVADGLRESNLPQLRGIAPGILEDAQAALDPRPVMGAIFGSQYPSCTLEAKMVGDQDGNIRNSATGNYYIENPERAYDQGGRKFQKRWVQSGTMTQAAWEKAPKTHCPDGSSRSNHRARDCSLELIGNEGFSEGEGASTALFTWENALAAAAVVGIAFIVKMKFI